MGSLYLYLLYNTYINTAHYQLYLWWLSTLHIIAVFVIMRTVMSFLHRDAQSGVWILQHRIFVTASAKSRHFQRQDDERYMDFAADCSVFWEMHNRRRNTKKKSCYHERLQRCECANRHSSPNILMAFSCIWNQPSKRRSAFIGFEGVWCMYCASSTFLLV